MLKFFEQNSKGCYYVNSCNISGEEGSKDSSVTMSITLYYFDTESAATAATEAVG